MSAEGLAPSVVANLESSNCKGWLRNSKEEEILEKMVNQTPDEVFTDESEEVGPESEPPPVAVRRKVSFADAFGLDLVSVKEYNNRESSGPGDLLPLLGAEGKAGEEYYLSCLFTCPASDQELEMRLHQQKLELESIEMLPGSTTIRGIVRVLNLCFHKAVYVHTTLDGWRSHFDLLAEYVPGSSDGETDRFSFQLTMTPPFEAEGARVEFCLRYESATGTFWANNRGTNYILFCHQRRRTEIKEKERERERDKEKLIEENNHKGIRSCLKTFSKKICTEATPPETSREISEQVAPWAERNRARTTDEEAEMTSPKSLKNCCKPLVDHPRKRRSARLAQVKDYFPQKEMEPLVDISHTGESASDWLPPTPRLSISNREDVPIVQNQVGQDVDTPPIPRYHEIPLLSLDWGGNKTSPTNAKPLNVYNRTIPEKPLVKDHLEKSACDAWEAFLSSTGTTHTPDDTQDQECVPYSGLSGSDVDVAPLVEEKVLNVHEGAFKDTSQSVTNCKGSVDWGAEGIQESYPTEKCNDSGMGHTKGQVVDYQPQEEPRVTPTTCAAYGSEPEEAELERRGDRRTPHRKYAGGPLSEDITLPLTSPGEEAQAAHDLQTRNSKGIDGISPEEFTGRPGASNAEAKVKENTAGEVSDTLTFTGIRDEPFAYRQTEGSSEKKDINKASEPERKDGVQQVEFHTELREEEWESVRKAQDGTLDQTTETQRAAFNESNLCTLNTNVKKDNSEIQKDEERRFEPVHEPQGLDAEDELPTLPSLHLSWAGSTASVGGNSRLLSWWGQFCSLGHVTRALVYSAVLFVIFVTAYLCDLPTCLALYLFSLCWWCSQGMKQRLDGASDVD